MLIQMNYEGREMLPSNIPQQYYNQECSEIRLGIKIKMHVHSQIQRRDKKKIQFYIKERFW